MQPAGLVHRGRCAAFLFHLAQVFLGDPVKAVIRADLRRCLFALAFQQGINPLGDLCAGIVATLPGFRQRDFRICPQGESLFFSGQAVFEPPKL